MASLGSAIAKAWSAMASLGSTMAMDWSAMAKGQPGVGNGQSRIANGQPGARNFLMGPGKPPKTKKLYASQSKSLVPGPDPPPQETSQTQKALRLSIKINCSKA